MGVHRTAWIVGLASLLAGCADGGAPSATPSQPSRVPHDEAPAAPAVTPPARPAAVAEGSAGPAQPSAARPAPPLTPKHVVATTLSSSQIALSWESPTESAPNRYEIFREESLVTTSTDPHFTDEQLRPWSRHCYAVRAVGADGQRSARSPLACAQTRDETPPTAPGELKVESKSVNAVTLTWSASSDDDQVDSYEVLRGEKVIGSVKTTGLVDEKLAPATAYCYSVRALDRARNRSLAAGPACVFVPDTTAPTVPTEVAASADGEHAITVRWKPSADDVGVARYEMSADDGAPRSVGAQTIARDDGLAVATRHCYGLRACDAAGNCSTWSEPACATTPDLTPPSQPPSPAATAASDTEVEVRWGAATDNVGVTAYEVLRGDEIVARTAGATSASEEGLHPARKYCYTVRALDAAGNRSIVSSAACATTPDLTPPTPPGRPAAIPVSSTQMFVAWDPSTDDVGIAGYEVYRGASLVAKVTATRAREKRLEAAHEYCYTVRAFDAAGNRSSAAGPICAVTAEPSELSAPSDLRVRRISLTNILLQWEPSEVKGILYRVYAQGNRDVGLTAATTFTPAGRLGAEPNCFRVAAVDTTGRESAKSNEACATGADGPVTSR
jgi:chitodextrinase